jgi:predicted ATPase
MPNASGKSHVFITMVMIYQGFCHYAAAGIPRAEN